MIGLVLVAVCAALATALVALAMSLPLWMALLTYALAGTGALLLCAGLTSLVFDRRMTPGPLATVRADR
jgi:hypothetical protein